MRNPMSARRERRQSVVAAALAMLAGLVALASIQTPVAATPANRAALSRLFGRFLARKLDNCTTCHLPLQPGKSPTSLADFPHNPFGNRLRLVGDELRRAGKKA